MTGYGENGTGDANDVWRLEIPGAEDGEIVRTVVSKYVYLTVVVHLPHLSQIHSF